MKRDVTNAVRWGIPLTVATLAIATPYFLTHGFPFLALALQRGFGLVCHQDPERSLTVFGGQVAVCARCLGIYAGVAAGAVAGVRRRAAVSLLALGVMLNLADVASESAGLHSNWMGVRFVLGVLLGFAAAAWVSGVERVDGLPA